MESTVIRAYITRTGRKVHGAPVGFVTRTFCGHTVTRSQRVMDHEWDLPDYCKTCQRAEAAKAKRERDEYERGCIAYTGISEELSCFGIPGHGECWGQCKQAKPEDFMDHTFAEKYAHAEMMPWPPCDIDTLYQEYPNHVELETRIWAEYGAK